MSQASASEKPAPGRRPVDRGDHRIGDPAQVDDRRVQRLGAAAHFRGQVDLLALDTGFEPVDVAAGAERLAGAGDDQRPQRRPVGEPGEGDRHLADHLRAHRVEGVGPVEREGADLAPSISIFSVFSSGGLLVRGSVCVVIALSP